jgi:hypothetical protein
MNMVDDCKMITDYVIEYEEVKKVATEQMKQFEEKIDEFLVLFKMWGYNSLKATDIFEYMCCEIGTYNNIEHTISFDNLSSVELKLGELFDCVREVEQEFERQTGISIYRSYVKVEKYFYYAMKREDVVQLTPKAQKLKDSGIEFKFQEWLDEN